jgi:carbon monoxide dehydrogenase subunit G
LVPGEYRVLAVAAKDAQSIHDPDVLARALPHAQKVELEFNRTARITLELLDLK